MKRVFPSCGLVLFVCTLGVASPLPNEARIDAIAKMLPGEPGFPELNVTNRVFWDKARQDPGCGYAIAQAERLLAKPVKGPDDALYEKVYGWNTVAAKNSEAIRQLTIAECLENKGRFLSKLIEYVKSKSAQTTWMNPYHDRPHFGNFHGKYRTTDLNTAADAQNLAIALDCLRGTLPADVEARAMAALWKHCYGNYLAKAAAPDAPDQKGRNAWFFGDMNWNVACHGWCVMAAERTIPDVRTRARFIEAAERAYPFYLNGFSSDGYCHEGLDYWNFGFGMFLHLAWTVRAATDGKVDFFAHPMARKDFLYAFECMQTDAVALRYGDGTAGSPSPDNLLLGGLAWPDLMTASARTRGANLNGAGSHPYRALPMIMGRLQPSGARSYERPVRSYFPEAQVLVCRPVKPTKTTLSACIRGGHNACPHNHTDVGQYSVAVGDVPVVEDPSGAAYTLETFTSKRYDSPILNSYSHAVPRPDRTLQGAGRAFASKIVGHGFSDRRDWIELDLAGCYQLTNAAKLAKLTRRFGYDRAAGVVTVEDAVAFTEPAAFETPISTFGRVVAGPDPNTFVILRASGADEARLLFSVDTHGAKWHVSEDVVVNPRRESPRRWAVVLDEPVKEATVTIRYRVDSGDGVRPNDCVAFRGAAAAQGGGECVNLFYATRYPGTDRRFAAGGAEKNPDATVFYDGGDMVSKDPLAFLDTFVRTFHAPGAVGEIRKSVYKQNSCEVACIERALPFPVESNGTCAGGCGAFVDDFNREILRIENLIPGTYRVTVDGKEIGHWTADQLGCGVNIATNAATPQFQQALKVKKLVADLWSCDPASAVAVRLCEEIKKAAKPVAHTFRAVAIEDVDRR